ncbi:MAG: hypothetical protein HY000_42235, partial [Planctomycetes bacterium]|nr:hypothetical protein [Planctomycetota bacterium]
MNPLHRSRLRRSLTSMVSLGLMASLSLPWLATGQEPPAKPEKDPPAKQEPKGEQKQEPTAKPDKSQQERIEQILRQLDALRKQVEEMRGEIAKQPTAAGQH